LELNRRDAKKRKRDASRDRKEGEWRVVCTGPVAGIDSRYDAAFE
jgi:hypothetical protein